MTAHSATTEMRRTRLGRSGMNVSRIAFGTWQLGGDWGATDEPAAIRAIRHAYDRGINFFDTAQGYGFGASEQLLAKAIQGSPRESVVIATKGGLRALGGPRVERDASAAWIRKGVDDSLRALARIALERGDEATAVRHLDRLAEFEPFDSDVQRELLGVLLAAGRRSEAMRCKFTNPVYYHGHIYGLDDGILSCVKVATGDYQLAPRLLRQYQAERLDQDGEILVSLPLTQIEEVGSPDTVVLLPGRTGRTSLGKAVVGRLRNDGDPGGGSRKARADRRFSRA